MGASTGVQNVVADVLFRNPVGNMHGSQISCAALRALALNSREQLIREQREDPELGHIYCYIENPDDGSVNATVCEGWSKDFKLIYGLLFYSKYSTTLGELRVYIPRSLREAIMKEFHDLPLAGHLGKRKAYFKLRDTCYFSYIRKYIFEYVSTCARSQKFNYKNALPSGRLIPIVSNYPNEIVTLDLLGPYPASRPERYRFLLVITDHFTKWSELIPLRKASAQTIANALFENYISRYGAPISLISDNGPNLYQRVRLRESEQPIGRLRKTCKNAFPRTIPDSFGRLDTPIATKSSLNGHRAPQGDAPHTLRNTGSSRSHPGKSKGSKKTSSEESKGRKSNKGNAGREERKVSQSIAGPSLQKDTRQGKPPTEGSRQEWSGQYDKTSKTARRNTRGAEEQWNRQYLAEQHQEKEPQHGNLRWRSGG
ncbi:transposon Ty3-I Gag-Pol polyprotein [Trichonephila clavipes]|nr:transposon Ty3-I Gag-Pol polyprotein [Trichonephila clavipes]